MTDAIEVVELEPLSDKHQIVLDKYLLCWNKTEAYLEAYKDITRESARASAARLFANVNFQAHLQRQLDHLHMTAEEAYKLTSDIARGDITQYLDEFGNVDMDTLKATGGGRLVKKVKQKTTIYTSSDGKGEDRQVTETELQLYDAQQAQRDILTIQGKIGNSRLPNEAPPPSSILFGSPDALVELVNLVEAEKRKRQEAERAIDGTIAESEKE